MSTFNHSVSPPLCATTVSKQMPAHAILGKRVINLQQLRFTTDHPFPVRMIPSEIRRFKRQKPKRNSTKLLLTVRVIIPLNNLKFQVPDGMALTSVRINIRLSSASTVDMANASSIIGSVIQPISHIQFEVVIVQLEVEPDEIFWGDL